MARAPSASRNAASLRRSSMSSSTSPPHIALYAMLRMWSASLYGAPPLQDAQSRIERLDECDFVRELVHGADAAACNRVTAPCDLVVDRASAELGSIPARFLSTLCSGKARFDLRSDLLAGLLDPASAWLGTRGRGRTPRARPA
jgi:hypothetical protein